MKAEKEEKEENKELGCLDLTVAVSSNESMFFFVLFSKQDDDKELPIGRCCSDA